MRKKEQKEDLGTHRDGRSELPSVADEAWRFGFSQSHAIEENGQTQQTNRKQRPARKDYRRTETRVEPNGTQSDGETVNAEQLSAFHLNFLRTTMCARDRRMGEGLCRKETNPAQDPHPPPQHPRHVKRTRRLQVATPHRNRKHSKVGGRTREQAPSFVTVESKAVTLVTRPTRRSCMTSRVADRTVLTSPSPSSAVSRTSRLRT